MILESFWNDFGIILESFWHHFGISLGSFWDHVGIILGSVWDHVGTVFEAVWDEFRAIYGQFFFLGKVRNTYGANPIFLRSEPLPTSCSGAGGGEFFNLP